MILFAIIVSPIIIALFLFVIGIRIIPPTHRGVIERLGKYNRFANAGFNWIIPVIESIRIRNITERMTNVNPQDIITKDNLNARVDLVVYHKVRETEEDVKRSYYNIEDYKTQIVMLAQTTARNVIGDMKFVDVNSQRNKLNQELANIIDKEIGSWGIDVVRVELKEITPPDDVQDTMNRVIKAQNEKDAAIDFATAKETEADGLRRSEIKKAEGVKQAKILEAEGEAEAIKLVNESAERYFKGNAKELKQMEVTQNSLKSNSKIIITKDGINPQLLIGNIPLKNNE